MSVWGVNKSSQVFPALSPECRDRNPPGYRAFKRNSCREQFSPFGLVSEGGGYAGDDWSSGVRIVALVLLVMAGCGVIIS